MTFGDLEAAMKTATAMGQSKIHVHIFVLAALLSKCREAVEIGEIQQKEMAR